MNECLRGGRSRTRKHPCRRGWTLVETVICMTIGALVFAAAVELLGFAMHSDSSDARSTGSFHSLDRLAEQFATDVRSASNVESKGPVKTETTWTMNLPDNLRIDYALQDHALLRTAYRADKVVERDAFNLGDEMTARLELQPKEQPTNATLVLERTAVDAPPTLDTLRITVPIGWNRRFAASVKSQKTE